MPVRRNAICPTPGTVIQSVHFLRESSDRSPCGSTYRTQKSKRCRLRESCSSPLAAPPETSGVRTLGHWLEFPWEGRAAPRRRVRVRRRLRAERQHRPCPSQSVPAGIPARSRTLPSGHEGYFAARFARRQDGWPAGQARTLLLAPAGGESFDLTLIRVDAPADPGAPGGDRLMRDGGRSPAGRREGGTRGTCPQGCCRRLAACRDLALGGSWDARST
jgi:hypothetical protein